MDLNQERSWVRQAVSGCFCHHYLEHSSGYIRTNTTESFVSFFFWTRSFISAFVHIFIPAFPMCCRSYSIRRIHIRTILMPFLWVNLMCSIFHIYPFIPSQRHMAEFIALQIMVWTLHSYTSCNSDTSELQVLFKISPFISSLKMPRLCCQFVVMAIVALRRTLHIYITKERKL